MFFTRYRSTVMRIRLFLLALLCLMVPRLQAQGLVCPPLRVCIFNDTTSSSKPVLENSRFAVWGVDSSFSDKWMSVQISGRKRKYVLRSQADLLNKIVGVAPDEARSSSRIPVKKEQGKAEANVPATTPPAPTTPTFNQDSANAEARRRAEAARADSIARAQKRSADSTEQARIAREKARTDSISNAMKPKDSGKSWWPFSTNQTLVGGGILGALATWAFVKAAGGDAACATGPWSNSCNGR